MNRFRLLALLALVWALPVSAQDWGEIAQISTTLGVQANRLCLGEGSRGDIGCPGYAPYVSGTTGYVGIGTSNPLHPLDISSSASNFGLRLSASSTRVSLIASSAQGGYGTLTQSGDSQLFFTAGSLNTGSFVLQPWNTTLAGGLRMISTGAVAFGRVTPTTVVDISGTIRVSNSGEPCDANRAGAIRWHDSAGEFQVCYGSGGWALLSSAATSGSTIVAALDDLTDATKDITNTNIFLGHKPGTLANNDGNTAVGLGVLASLSNSAGADEGDFNSGFGYNALAANTSGAFNNGFGYETLKNNTVGSNNSALGYAALYRNTTGNDNNVLGYGALYNNTTGASNVAIGFGSLTKQTASSGQVAIGHRAMYYVSGTAADAAVGNIAIGYQALQGSSTATDNTGDYNTVVGFNTLIANTTGSFNSGFGYNALSANTIGASNSSFGYLALSGNTTGNSNVAVGVNSLYSQQNSGGQTAIGYEAMRYVSGTAVDAALFNTAVGYNALRGSSTPSNNTGDQNTAIGYSALINNTTGRSNNAMGTNSLYDNTTGSNNAAMGYSALRYNTTGQNNTALGHGTLFYQQNSVAQTAVGYLAMYYISGTTADPATANTAVGNLALLGSVTTTDNTGDQNTALGYAALVSNTSGSYNTAIGTQSLYNTTTGSQNTALGRNAGYWLVTGSSNILIGYGADTPANNTSNFLNIGNAISGTYTTGGVINFLAGIKSAGVVTATYFEGDGSRLTNLAAATSDRIVSGTTSVVAYSVGGISATTDLEVSGTVKIAGTGSEPCGPALRGTIRQNPVTMKLEVCRY